MSVSGARYDLEFFKKVYDPNAERITEHGSVENGDLELYVVPAGHSLYLEEVELSIWLDAQIGSSEYCYVYWARGMVYIRDLCRIFWYMDKGAVTMMKVGDHAVFPSGLLIPAGDVIWLVSPATGYVAEGSISGHLVVEDA